jgi:hypothetical protein
MVIDRLVAHRLPHATRLRLQPRQTVVGIAREVMTIEIVQHSDVEGQFPSHPSDQRSWSGLQL